MPRPQKKRCVCCMPRNKSFTPSTSADNSTVTLTLDEYETIRLIDLESCTQAQCAEQMHVARTTIQGIYNDARKKIADALVNGRKLIISGGDYVLCQHHTNRCGKGCKGSCHRHQCPVKKSEDTSNENSSNL